VTEIEVPVWIISIVREEENIVFENVNLIKNKNKSISEITITNILFKLCIVVEEEERKNKVKVSEEYSSTTSLYQQPSPGRKVSILIEDTGDNCHLALPTMVKATSSSSNETLTGG